MIFYNLSGIVNQYIVHVEELDVWLVRIINETTRWYGGRASGAGYLCLYTLHPELVKKNLFEGRNK